jgi:hypothetical protein
VAAPFGSRSGSAGPVRHTGPVPVAQSNPRRTLLVAVAALVFAAGLLAVVLVANDTSTGTSGGIFDQAGVEELIRLQEEGGDAPVLFPDPVGGRQPIYVFHTGGDPEEGWVAYDALVDGCPFEDVRETGDQLVDSCTGDTYPFTGEGLPQYEVEVVDGRLAVQLVEDDAEGS